MFADEHVRDAPQKASCFSARKTALLLYAWAWALLHEMGSRGAHFSLHAFFAIHANAYIGGEQQITIAQGVTEIPADAEEHVLRLKVTVI